MIEEDDNEATKVRILLTPQEIREIREGRINQPSQVFEYSIQEPQQQQQPQQTKIPQQILYQYAQQAALRTNDRMTKARHDLTFAIKQLQKSRQTTQPYLNNSMHFQADNYPVILVDPNGKTLYNPNNSQSVTQSSLEMFIKKNLNEEPNSYLSQVAGYNNFAIQNRRRRKHHFQ